MELGGQLLQFLVEAFTGSIIVKNLPRHVVYVCRYIVAVLLCDMTERMALRKVAADYPVVPLVAPPLTACIGVTVIDGQLLATVRIVLHALTVLELGAIINRNSLEGIGGELQDDGAQSVYRGLSCLTENTDNKLIACQSFCQNEKAFALAFGLAYHAIKFPMPEGGTVVYLFRAVFYAGSSGWPLCLYMMIVPFPLWLFKQVFVSYVRDIALVYVAVQRGRGDGPFTLFTERSGYLVRGTALFYLI